MSEITLQPAGQRVQGKPPSLPWCLQPQAPPSIHPNFLYSPSPSLFADVPVGGNGLRKPTYLISEIEGPVAAPPIPSLIFYRMNSCPRDTSSSSLSADKLLIFGGEGGNRGRIEWSKAYFYLALISGESATTPTKPKLSSQANFPPKNFSVLLIGFYLGISKA